MPKIKLPKDSTGYFKNRIITNELINRFDTSLVEIMDGMFEGATFVEDVDLNCWDVSKVKSMKNMFRKAKGKSPNISNWNVSNVMDMSGMFSYSTFDGDISRWDVSNVRDMSYMFAESKFNGDISQWDVSNV
ncbi:MAG: hypothetical protein KatS3mg101_0885 [Patescibacteria group bacterium]|nr:MAG: hypothetical protein KatS3mg101_0885 [Patescibacteria group bacterium]